MALAGRLTAVMLGLATGLALTSVHAQQVQQAADAAVPAAPAVQEETAGVEVRRPLIVIRFNQKNVYYTTALTQAVQKAEAVKPGILYRVVSYVPGDESGNARMDEASVNNLRAVVNTMVGLGVPSSRINVNTQPLARAGSQEIHVFVY